MSAGASGWDGVHFAQFFRKKCFFYPKMEANHTKKITFRVFFATKNCLSTIFWKKEAIGSRCFIRSLLHPSNGWCRNFVNFWPILKIQNLQRSGKKFPFEWATVHKNRSTGLGCSGGERYFVGPCTCFLYAPPIHFYGLNWCAVCIEWLRLPKWLVLVVLQLSFLWIYDQLVAQANLCIAPTAIEWIACPWVQLQRVNWTSTELPLDATMNCVGLNLE